jgi:hypothetical protein
MNMAKMQNLIVDDRARGVFRVNRRAFTDPEILEQERREVFDLLGFMPAMTRRSPIRAIT